MEDEMDECPKCHMMSLIEIRDFGTDEFEGVMCTYPSCKYKQTEEKMIRKEFDVDKRNNCLRVFIPKGYCTVYLQGIKDSDIEFSQLGNDVCVEVLDKDLPCINKCCDK